MSEYIIALIMGIIEGITEFLPVSSSGHLILAGHLMNFTGEKAKTFEVVIQLGSILAIAVLFRKKLISLINVKSIKTNEKQLNIIHIILGIIPAGLIGLLLHGFIKEYLFSPKTVVVGLILGALLMIFAEKKKKTITANNIDELTYKQALYIGLFQCLAVYPGFSRSGSTISGGLLVGASYTAAAEFSFIIALPMMIAASGLDLLKSYQYLTTDDIAIFAIGFITAFVVAMFAVSTFLKLLENVKLTPFAIYRILLAIVFAIIIF
ncbi:undecaprenyl-diphosphate phosphatase [Bacillus sp. Brlt_9]|uniref:undecaprenyl-diphosphate phosphatase n=1 Tax=Bacillus sp. Brlt_9 TaxID=3110916 RepID=UPI003F7BF49B